MVLHQGMSLHSTALLLWLFSLTASLLLPGGVQATDPVTLDDTSKSSEIVLSNGIVSIAILNPWGDLLRISYGGKPNLLIEWPENYSPPPDPEPISRADSPTSGLPGGARSDRGYWNANWDSTNDTNIYDSFECDTYSVLTQTDDLVTLKFTRKYIDSPDTSTNLPADVSVFYSLAAGDSGFYTWTVLEHPPEYPSGSLAELRFTLKLDQSFRWASLGKRRQRWMPEWDDLSRTNSEPTLNRETRRLLTPSNPEFKNEYDSKYNYLMDTGDQLVYGWASNGTQPLGIWMVSPYKYEYAPGGPTKQDLTLQTGPYLFNYLHSLHLGTPPVILSLGQKWSKTYGPFKVYLNQYTAKETLAPEGNSSAQRSLYEDARSASVREYRKWPYAQFADKAHYPGPAGRGNVTGALSIPDSAGIDLSQLDLKRSGWVALAASHSPGSWASEVAGYQFWVHFVSRNSARFAINNVRPGKYRLHIYILGIYGDYCSEDVYTVTAGATLNVGTVEWSPPRLGPTVFELGVPDKDSAEFYVPEINPGSPYPYSKPNENAFRNYGVWDAYQSEHPTGDPVYVVGASDWAQDWWYMQMPRYSTPTSGVPTVYTIQFNLTEAPGPTDMYVLRLALAGKKGDAIQVFVNNKAYDSTEPLIDTSSAYLHYNADDNGMARLASHGSYSPFEVPILGTNFVQGINFIYLRQRQADTSGIYVAYDYIRLEGPMSSIG